MESSDFKGNNILPVDLHELPTEFHIVKSAGSRFVVVMDVSGSMKEFVSLHHQNTNNVHKFSIIRMLVICIGSHWQIGRVRPLLDKK